ncbi:MAG: hypothetical protein ACRD0Z_15065 [Acidimicrobiales bacterium]
MTETTDAARPNYGARERLQRAMRRGKYLVGRDPALLPILLRLTPLGLSRKITGSTSLVVEGFPRGGNTFMVFVLQDAVDHALRISSHCHLPAQVKHAVHLGIPTVLVVREPVELLASYLVYGPHATAAEVLKEYTTYHRQLVPYLEQLLVVDFEEITTDMSAVIARINERYHLGIPNWEHSQDNVQRIFADIDAHHAMVHPRLEHHRGVPHPSHLKDEAKEQYRAELLSPHNTALRVSAQQAYGYFSRARTERRHRQAGEPDAGFSSPVRRLRSGLGGGFSGVDDG